MVYLLLAPAIAAAAAALAFGLGVAVGRSQSRQWTVAKTPGLAPISYPALQPGRRD